MLFAYDGALRWRSCCKLAICTHARPKYEIRAQYIDRLYDLALKTHSRCTTANSKIGFKRIHCLTFGTPPISLLPLTKPSALKYKKSLFMSFINEGDPVPRADKAYIRSLLNLYASPTPGTKCVTPPKPTLKPALKPCKRPKPKRATSAPAAPVNAPVWKLPPGTLSNAGRLIVLRGPQNVGLDGQTDVKAEITTDQELRTVVFGDPVMHMMKVYAKRIEVLATKAVTVKIWG